MSISDTIDAALELAQVISRIQADDSITEQDKQDIIETIFTWSDDVLQPPHPAD